MSSVDFYILPDDKPSSVQDYACKLAEIDWLKGDSVFIQTDSEEETLQIDELLWKLDGDSFIPHGIATLEPSDLQQPILISHQKVNHTHFNSVINLSSRPSGIAGNAELKIREILNQNEQRKQSGRNNYKTYRSLGYTLEHHTLESIDG